MTLCCLQTGKYDCIIQCRGNLTDSAARFFHDNYAPMLAEVIHWPLQGWQNIKNGAPLMYNAGTNAQHRNHVQ